MPSTTSFEFGSVVLVPFPFTDQSTAKRRPAVVVSSESYHRQRPDLILMAITSQHRATTVGEAVLAQWQQAGLIKPSVLKPLLTTIERKLIIRKLGDLQSNDRAALRNSLDSILGQ